MPQLRAFGRQDSFVRQRLLFGLTNRAGGCYALPCMDSDSKKTVAAVSSVIWSAALTAMKFAVGLLTGSLGILSEALHSGLDLLAAAGTLYAVRVAARPADEEHPYGHGKIENLMALGETLLLLATSGWVIMEAFSRLADANPDSLRVETSVWAFVVVIVSLVVDINRARMLKRVAKETKSAALEADAAHFATDIWSSAAVLVGISGAAVAGMTMEGTWLHWVLVRADVFASLVVAFLILTVCHHLGKQAINNLMDKADGVTAATIRQVMAERMPAYPLERLRVREVGNRCYVEMAVRVPRHLHVDTAHEIADAIEHLVADSVEGAETIVHMQPYELAATSPEMMVRQLALTHRFGVHGLVLMHADEGYIVFTDLELPAEATFDSWGVAIQAFRNEVRRHLGADRVVVHVEPDVREIPAFDIPLPPGEEWEQQVRRAMITMGAPLPLRVDCYTKGAQRLCIVTIPDEPLLSVADSHKRLSLLKKQLTAALPRAARIIVAYK